MESKLKAKNLIKKTLDLGLLDEGKEIKTFLRNLAQQIETSIKIKREYIPWNNKWTDDLPSFFRQIEFDLFDFIDNIFDLGLDTNSKSNILVALMYSAFLHKNQMRKREMKPYLVHLLRVAAYVAYFINRSAEKGLQIIENDKTKTELIIAALLHDSVEDHALSLAIGRTSTRYLKQNSLRTEALKTIEDKFGVSVRHWVATLSKPDWGKKTKGIEYSKWLRLIWQDGSTENTIIKLADIFDNLDASLNDIERIFNLKVKGFVLNKNEKRAHFKDWELVIKYLKILIALQGNYDRWLKGTVLEHKNVKEFLLSELQQRIDRANRIFRASAYKGPELLAHVNRIMNAC